VAEKEKKGGDDKQNIIIKRVKKVAGGHHGGAWKVAYADFVTAMMAFFLLLWLLSVTTNVQKQRIADYFSPTDPRISSSENGSGGVLGGTTVSPDGAKTDDAVAPDAGKSEEEEKKDQEQNAATDKSDEKNFKETQENLRQSIESVPELQEYMPNLLIDMTPEGLRIQIIDTANRPMFEKGSAVPLPQTVKLISMITNVLRPLPNKISVRGHTDSLAYGKDASYTNWELSADRANASRRIMLGAGLDATRVENVQGKADRELLDTTDPTSPKNRRISLIVLKQSVAAAAKKASVTVVKRPSSQPTKPEPRKKEEGVIYFP
jgi:chemotaxis protein MotB